MIAGVIRPRRGGLPMITGVIRPRRGGLATSPRQILIDIIWRWGRTPPFGVTLLGDHQLCQRHHGRQLISRLRPLFGAFEGPHVKALDRIVLGVDFVGGRIVALRDLRGRHRLTLVRLEVHHEVARLPLCSYFECHAHILGDKVRTVDTLEAVRICRIFHDEEQVAVAVPREGHSHLDRGHNLACRIIVPLDLEDRVELIRLDRLLHPITDVARIPRSFSAHHWAVSFVGGWWLVFISFVLALFLALCILVRHHSARRSITGVIRPRRGGLAMIAGVIRPRRGGLPMITGVIRPRRGGLATSPRQILIDIIWRWGRTPPFGVTLLGDHQLCQRHHGRQLCCRAAQLKSGCT